MSVQPDRLSGRTNMLSQLGYIPIAGSIFKEEV